MSDNQGKHIISGGVGLVLNRNCYALINTVHTIALLYLTPYTVFAVFRYPLGYCSCGCLQTPISQKNASCPDFMAEEVECPRQSVRPWGPVSQSLSIPFILIEPAKSTGLSSHPIRPTNGDRNNPLQGSRALWRVHGAVSPSRTRGLKNKQAPR